ncbi:MAG: RNA polymerase sigma factor [Novosphingobium sp.]
MQRVNDERPDSGGLDALFARHRAELLRFLTARCGDADEAQDALQELWIKAAGQSGGPIANGRAYLFRMANNLVLDRRRSRHRAMRRDRSWLDDTGEGNAPPEERPDPAPRADEALERSEEAELLRQTINGLPPGARRALWLYRFEGHSQGEVAQIMKISRSGVEKHLATAMKQLKSALTDCGLVPAAASGKQGHSGGDDPQSETQ